ncbi:hypothetical protein [Methanothermobacter sp. KEPCO 2]|uniref:hypothetical protein n=1 Tax=Methanothermobacter sp. KEPCO 2 TaxID=3240977 RepID=UPI003511534D
MKSSEGFRITSTTGECPECVYRCEVVLEDLGEIKLYCRHPMGPGRPAHCIYFKRDRKISR